MATFFKHSFVVVIIKHDLEIRKAQSIFSRLLDVNIETLYVGDLNECVRFFGFVARRVTLCNRSKSQSGGGLDRGEEEDDENTNNLDSSLTAYLEDSRRIMEIVATIPDLDEEDSWQILSNFKTLKQLSNASVQEMAHCLSFSNRQIEAIYNAFNTKHGHIDSE